MAALTLPRPPPVEMPLGRPPSSEELPCAAPDPPPRAVLSMGAVGPGVAAVSPNPPAPAGLPPAPSTVLGCVSTLAAAAGAGVTGGGVAPRPSVGGGGAGVVGGGVAAAWPSSVPFPPVPAGAKLQCPQNPCSPPGGFALRCSSQHPSYSTARTPAEWCASAAKK